MEISEPQKAKACALYGMGWSLREVASECSVVGSTVSKWLQRAGIKTRSQSEGLRLCISRGHRVEKGLFVKGHLTLPEVRRKISQTLRAKGVKPTAWAHYRQRKYFISQEIADEIVSLYSKGILSEIARKFKISESAVYRTLLKNGVKCRSASENSRIKWSNPEWAARQVELTRRGSFKRPTKPEQKLINIIKQYHLPFKYTGDGSFVVAGLNPDFVNVNGAKVAIDVFGDYWHGKGASSIIATEAPRKAKFAEFGWDLVILWESELKKMPDDEVVKRIVSEPQNKGKEVTCGKVY